MSFITLKAKGSVPWRSNVKQKKQWNVLCAVANAIFLSLLGNLANSGGHKYEPNVLSTSLSGWLTWLNTVAHGAVGPALFFLSISETHFVPPCFLCYDFFLEILPDVKTAADLLCC